MADPAVIFSSLHLWSMQCARLVAECNKELVSVSSWCQSLYIRPLALLSLAVALSNFPSNAHNDRCSLCWLVALGISRTCDVLDGWHGAQCPANENLQEQLHFEQAVAVCCANCKPWIVFIS